MGKGWKRCVVRGKSVWRMGAQGGRVCWGGAFVAAQNSLPMSAQQGIVYEIPGILYDDIDHFIWLPRGVTLFYYIKVAFILAPGAQYDCQRHC